MRGTGARPGPGVCRRTLAGGKGVRRLRVRCRWGLSGSDGLRLRVVRGGLVQRPGEALSPLVALSLLGAQAAEALPVAAADVASSRITLVPEVVPMPEIPTNDAFEFARKGSTWTRLISVPSAGAGN